MPQYLWFSKTREGSSRSIHVHRISRFLCKYIHVIIHYLVRPLSTINFYLWPGTTLM